MTDGLAIAGLVGVLFLKEAGLPIPVPGDLLVIGAGIAASGLGAAAPLQLAAILLAGYAGGSVQYWIVRGALRDRFLAALARLGVPPQRLEALAGWLHRRGVRGVAVARATPGLRIGAVAASGIAGLPFRGVFLPGLVLGNGLFVGGHFALGYVAGPPALSFLSTAGSTALAVVAVALLAGLGAVVWRALQRRRAAAVVGAGQVGPPAELPGWGSWAEASCPACLAITLVAGRRERR
jgi:membrane protein DedA with SNARE-associated domain